MFIKLVFIVCLASSAVCRNVPRYADLDEEDRLLFRAAYDTPTYDHEEYQEDEELPIGKLDLLKDGMWAIKAKIKEMKIFNKALAANLLYTKLQLKELLATQLKPLKKHHHVEIEKNKPIYNYPKSLPPSPAYSHYEAPHYIAPEASVPQYGPSQHGPSQYELPQYGPPQHGSPQYGPPQYEPPQYDTHQYGAPQYGIPQYGHDPYYGH